jgi:hypothetical protein
MREWKISFNPTHLSPRQQKQISHGEASQPPPLNQPIRTQARTLIGPEPKGRPKGGKNIKNIKNIMTYFLHELSRKIDIKQRGEIRKITAREAMAMTITNLALKGDPKLLPS